MNNQQPQPWPKLNFDELKDTIATVHLWTQIVGKIRLKLMPWLNHSWHVTLYVSARGLTTGSIPYKGGIFQIDIDFIAHELIISSSEGGQQVVKLYARTVASFYNEVFAKLELMNIEAAIHAQPNEVDPAIPFAQDEEHCSYIKEQMHLLWLVLVKVERVFTHFRAGFRGKCSPVHFFWGAFDLAVTRFSGREAPLHPGGAPHMPNRVMQEAYSHEVSSCGFWPGNEQTPIPMFYSYCYPTPDDFKKQPVEPEQAVFNEEMGEFILRYEDVRNANDPEATLLQFLKSTYKAAARTGEWAENLECDLRYLES